MLSEATKDVVRACRAHSHDARASMLDCLRAVQDAKGWVSDEDLREIADIIGVSTAELEDLATFYSLIFRQPVGDRLILWCDGVACYLNGGERVRDALETALGIRLGETTPDGKTTLINICCIGACDRAPAALRGKERRLVGPIDPDNLSPLLEDGG